MATYTHVDAKLLQSLTIYTLTASYVADTIDTTLSDANFSIYALAGNDQINLGNGHSVVYGGEGEDAIYNVDVGDTIYGDNEQISSASNQVSFNFSQSELVSVTKYLLPQYSYPLGNNTGGLESHYVFKTPNGEVFLKAISEVSFSDTNSFVATDSLVTHTESIETSPPPTPGFPDPKLGTENTDVIIGNGTDEFFNLLGGNDAVDAGGGDDILDGGLGSNFLTGGDGNDTFFLDGRSEGSTTWSTITDFTSGDFVNIWGWVEGTSQLLLTEALAGAEGFRGVTNHYDLNNDGVIDTSITFTGKAVPSNSPQSVQGNGYLSFS